MGIYRLRYSFLKGWDPQQKYTMGQVDGDKWFPLNDKGYWLEPDAFNEGRISAHNYFPRSEARHVIMKAKSINQESIKIVTP